MECPLCFIQTPNQIGMVCCSCGYCGRKMCSACKCDCVYMTFIKNLYSEKVPCEVCDKPTFNGGYYTDEDGGACEGFICRECYAKCGDVDEEYYDEDDEEKDK